MTAACGSDDNGAGAERLDRLVIAPENSSVVAGGSLQLRVEAIYTTGVDTTPRSENVTFNENTDWTSSDPSVAVFEDATLKAEAPGETTVTASYGGETATTLVFVEPAVEEVELSPRYTPLFASELSIQYGSTSDKIDATGIATNNTKRDVSGEVIWGSSDQSVATVDGTGNVLARGAGETTITASRGGQVVDAVEVEVFVADDELDGLAMGFLGPLLSGLDPTHDVILPNANSILLPFPSYGEATVSDSMDNQFLVEVVEHNPADEDEDPWRPGDEDEEDFEPGPEVVSLFELGGLYAVIGTEPGVATLVGHYIEPRDDPFQPPEILATTEEITITVLTDQIYPEEVSIAGAPEVISTYGVPFDMDVFGDFGETVVEDYEGYDGVFDITGLVAIQHGLPEDAEEDEEIPGDEILRLRGTTAEPRAEGEVTFTAIWNVDIDPPDNGEEPPETVVGRHTVEVVETDVSEIEIVAASPAAVRAVATFGSITQDVTAAARWSTDDSCAFVDNASSRAGQITSEADCEADIEVYYRGAEDTLGLDELPEPEG